MSRPPVRKTSQETAAPPLTFGKWLQERVTPAVIVAFLGGAATVIAAYFAATPHLDKTICSITTSDMKRVTDGMRQLSSSITIYTAKNSTSMLELSNRLLNANRAFSNNLKDLQKNRNADDKFSLTDVFRTVSPFEDLNFPYNVVETIQVSSAVAVFMSDLNALYLSCPK